MEPRPETERGSVASEHGPCISENDVTMERSAREATEHEQRLEARVTGRVQGVGFRHFTTQQARRLGLGGWVRNERDGTVYLVAEGPREALDALLDALQRGPSAARVTDVQAHWMEAAGTFDDFSVRYF